MRHDRLELGGRQNQQERQANLQDRPRPSQDSQASQLDHRGVEVERDPDLIKVTTPQITAQVLQQGPELGCRSRLQRRAVERPRCDRNEQARLRDPIDRKDHGEQHHHQTHHHPVRQTQDQQETKPADQGRQAEEEHQPRGENGEPEPDPAVRGVTERIGSAPIPVVDPPEELVPGTPGHGFGAAFAAVARWIRR